MKLKFVAEKRDVIIFATLCFFLLFLIAIVISNVKSIMEFGSPSGINFLIAFYPNNILITFGVLNLDKSSSVIFEQWSNIYSISLTFITTKFDRSIVVKDLHSPKIWLIFITRLVLNKDKLIEVKL